MSLILTYNNTSQAGDLKPARPLAVEWVDFCRLDCVALGHMEAKMTENVPEDMRKKWLSRIFVPRITTQYELKDQVISSTEEAIRDHSASIRKWWTETNHLPYRWLKCGKKDVSSSVRSRLSLTMNLPVPTSSVVG